MSCSRKFLDTMTDFHHDYAEMIGKAICYDLRNAVDRIEIVGAIRRKEKYVQGVSIVYVSKVENETDTQGDLFGGFKKKSKQQVNLAEKTIQSLYWYLEYLDKPTDALQKKKMINPKTGVPVDLFPIESVMDWGVALTIRTGTARFAQSMIEAAREKGYRCDGHKMWRMNDNSYTPVSTEEAFFRLCEKEWIEPEKR